MLNKELRDLTNATQGLPQKFREGIDLLSEKFKESYKIQKSSERILSFLVDDILDFAQIGANKFRERITRFKLPKSVHEIIKILKFKADSLGIQLKTSYHGFN